MGLASGETKQGRGGRTAGPKQARFFKKIHGPEITSNRVGQQGREKARGIAEEEDRKQANIGVVGGGSFLPGECAE